MKHRSTHHELDSSWFLVQILCKPLATFGTSKRTGWRAYLHRLGDLSDVSNRLDAHLELTQGGLGSRRAREATSTSHRGRSAGRAGEEGGRHWRHIRAHGQRLAGGARAGRLGPGPGGAERVQAIRRSSAKPGVRAALVAGWQAYWSKWEVFTDWCEWVWWGGGEIRAGLGA